MHIPFGRPGAYACVRGGEEAPRLGGMVHFYQACDGVLVVAEIHGLPESETGVFAFHIHEGTNCCGTGFSDSLGHYNPQNTLHPNHAGDLPPLFSCAGRAYLAVLTDRFRICDVIGRTVIIHSGPDDFHTQPSGNPGAKIACGVIRGAGG